MDEKIDLNAPAFGEGSQPADFLEAVAPIESSVEEPVVEKEPEPSQEENKVPYSRFKKFHERAIEAEREAREWQAKYEANQRVEPAKVETDMPDWWEEMYGDSEASMKAYQIHQRQEEATIQRAEERAIAALQERVERESRQTQENIEQIDEQFEDLSSFVGRDLTEKEQSAILDIIDDYTPKGDDGKYLGATLPIDKAWEIYELKNEASKAPQRQSRNNVAALSNSNSQGDPDAEEKNKNFNPMNWSGWKSRL
jgi:hypothetical protein